MLEPIRILFVEDDERDADLIVRELKRTGLQFVWTRVDTPAAYQQALEGDLDLVLSDFGLPGFDGMQALELLKVRRPEVPFILVSGSIGEQTAVTVMRQGAADYLLKDRLGRLPQAVRQALAQGELQREQRRAEERIREQAEMLDRAHDAILVVDAATRRITYWNLGAVQVYGWSSPEVIGKTYGQIFGSEETQERIFTELLSKGDWHGELRHASRGAGKLIISSHASLLPRPSGEAGLVLFIDRDVTQQRSLETQLLRAQRMESLGTLAGGVAHDLNNVLAPILMGVQLLQRELTGPNASLLAAMEASCLRGASLVKQVLAFARGVEGDRRPVNPVEVMGELQKIVRDTFPKRIVLDYQVDPQVWSILGDSTQIYQIVMNLCVNARDAMPEGGRLQLTARNIVIDDTFTGQSAGVSFGAYVLLQVSDTGIGMTPEIRERIFDPFFTTKEVGQGTGLGLSTSMAIVRGHGGFINVYSEVGKGTNFLVYLPAITTPLAHRPPPSRDELPRGAQQLILVADDEEAIRLVAQKTLERFNYRVLLAVHGAEAVGLYAQYRKEVAVVVADMEMPILDGPATMVALKAINPEVKIIAASGLDDSESVARAVNAGVAQFLPKPYTAETMLRTIAKVITESSARPASPA